MKTPLSDINAPRTSLPGILLQRAAKHGNKIAFIDPVIGRQYSFADFAVRVTKLGSALARSRLMKGDVVCIYSSNCVDVIVVFLAVTSVGGVVSFADSRYTSYELERVLQGSDVSYLFCEQSLVANGRVASANVNTVKEIISFGRSPDCTSIEDLYNSEGASSIEGKLGGIEMGDVLAIFYSSGTTGLPKGVQITHSYAVTSMLRQGHPAITFSLRPGSELSIAFLPFSHIFGMLIILQAIYVGDCVVTMGNFNIELYLDYIQRYKATALFLVPPIAVTLTTHPLVDQTDFSSVRDIVSAAAPLDKETTQKLLQRLKVPKCRQSYGMTEVGIATCAPHQGWKHGSIGIPVSGVEMKVIDKTISPDDVGPNVRGELWIRHPTLMKGYLNDPRATREMIDEDGWLHSGDIGYYDTDGHFYIVDRLKEIIKYKGYQVAPAELEAVLLGHPSVSRAAVIGIPDELAGELPRAYVVLKPGKQATAKDIQEYAGERLAPYKKLRGGVEFVDDIPTSPSGKLLRRHLRDRFAQSAKSRL